MTALTKALPPLIAIAIIFGGIYISQQKVSYVQENDNDPVITCLGGKAYTTRLGAVRDMFKPVVVDGEQLGCD